MPWVKGQSGNPNGRKPGERALTAILEQYGNRTVDTPAGRLAGKRRLAQLTWQGALTGRVDFGDRVVTLSGRGWSDLVQWLYAQIDGPPTLRLQHGSDPDAPLTVNVHELRDFDLAGFAGLFARLVSVADLRRDGAEESLYPAPANGAAGVLPESAGS